MGNNDITIVTPSIPPRAGMLQRMLSSVYQQTRIPEAISIAIDREHLGAGPTRTAALMAAKTEWVAFVDDDDWLLPLHLELLRGHALDENADVVWPWFEVYGGVDPFPENRGKQWDLHEPHMFPITTLVRTELAQGIGGFTEVHPSGEISGEDHPFFVKLSETGAKFSHLDEITWTWAHHASNTSGLGSRW